MESIERRQEKRKVDYPIFVWVITILSGSMLAISSYLFTENGRLRTDYTGSISENRALIRELTVKLEGEREKNTSILIRLNRTIIYLK